MNTSSKLILEKDKCKYSYKYRYLRIGLTVMEKTMLARSVTFWVEQPSDTQVSLCHTEGLLQVLYMGLSVHLTHVNQSRPGDRAWRRLVKL